MKCAAFAGGTVRYSIEALLTVNTVAAAAGVAL